MVFGTIINSKTNEKDWWNDEKKTRKLTGDNSIIKKANDAKVENEKAEIKDILGIAINTIAIERGENKEYYKDKETFIEKGKLDIDTYAIDDYEYNLDNNLVQFKIYKKMVQKISINVKLI